jgi:hypothetical protein
MCTRYILEARELPILSMIVKIQKQLSARHYHKDLESQQWSSGLCPKILKKLNKNVDYAATCYAEQCGQGIFDVNDRGVQYKVDINKWTCACRRWDLTGIACSHSISCCREERILPEQKVHNCYTIENFRQAYAHIIYPCRDIKEWTRVNGRKVLPPKYEKKRGRKARNRRKEPEELEGPNGEKMVSRHGRIMHCSHCGGPNHNRGGCYYYKNGIDPKHKESTRVGADRLEQLEPDQDDPVITQASPSQRHHHIVRGHVRTCTRHHTMLT